MSDLRTFIGMIALFGCAVPARAQEAVPVHREPRHRLVLDSTRFRVLDVQIPAGDTTRFHIHDTAILYVAISPSPTSVQRLGQDWPATPASQFYTAVGQVRVDSTYVLQPVTHRVTNSGPSTYRLLAITSSQSSSGSGADASRSLPGAVELRSSWFMQARALVPAGSTTEWFTSARPVLVVQPLAAGLVVECGGDVRQPLDGPGGWFLVPAHRRCRVRNDGSGSATAVAIQIR